VVSSVRKFVVVAFAVAVAVLSGSTKGAVAVEDVAAVVRVQRE
jgi:hypothetical protein